MGEEINVPIVTMCHQDGMWVAAETWMDSFGHLQQLCVTHTSRSDYQKAWHASKQYADEMGLHFQP